MSLARSRFRQCASGAFPMQCAAYTGNSLEICTSSLAGGVCYACERSGDIPLPRTWQRGGRNLVGRASVQLIPASGGVWLVVVFANGLLVDPRFPIAACRCRADAVELALDRGRQIAQREPVRSGQGEWRAGALLIVEAGA